MKWEYALSEFEVYAQGGMAQLIGHLNEKGELGWELVHILPLTPDGSIYQLTFKRLKEE